MGGHTFSICWSLTKRKQHDTSVHTTLSLRPLASHQSELPPCSIRSSSREAYTQHSLFGLSPLINPSCRPAASEAAREKRTHNTLSSASRLSSIRAAALQHPKQLE